MKLYSAPLSMFGAKAEIAALEKDLPVEIEHVGFSLKDLYEPKHPEVLRINPKAQVPVLIDDGLELYDSTQIFEYFEDVAPEPPLWPTGARKRAQARLLELQSDEVFFPNVALLMPRQRARAGEEAVAVGIASLHAHYDAMDARLRGREYLAGDFSYADIAFYMAQFFATFLGEGPGEERKNLDTWKKRMGRRDSVAKVAGAMAAYLTSQGIPAPDV